MTVVDCPADRMCGIFTVINEKKAPIQYNIMVFSTSSAVSLQKLP